MPYCLQLVPAIQSFHEMRGQTIYRSSVWKLNPIFGSVLERKLPPADQFEPNTKEFYRNFATSVRRALFLWELWRHCIYLRRIYFYVNTIYYYMLEYYFYSDDVYCISIPWLCLRKAYITLLCSRKVHNSKQLVI